MCTCLSPSNCWHRNQYLVSLFGFNRMETALTCILYRIPYERKTTSALQDSLCQYNHTVKKHKSRKAHKSKSVKEAWRGSRRGNRPSSCFKWIIVRQDHILDRPCVHYKTHTHTWEHFSSFLQSSFCVLNPDPSDYKVGTVASHFACFIKWNSMRQLCCPQDRLEHLRCLCFTWICVHDTG